MISRGAGSGGIVAISDRAFAALKAGIDPQVDFFEENDPLLPKGGIEAGLWVGFDAEVRARLRPAEPAGDRVALRPALSRLPGRAGL